MIIGAHVSSTAPLAEAAARDADAVQIFLSNPKSWKKPLARSDAAVLRSSGLPIFVHAPYLINVASGNNRVRIPSRKIIADTLAAAEEIGATGVVVHGGHLDDGEDLTVGFDRWRKALESTESTVPVLIENTAGGGNAVLRDLDNYGRLWEVIGGHRVGVCLDTCHAWAAGEDLSTVAERIDAMTGGIDLVHCNDSRDPFGSHRDRHTNLGTGEIPLELVVATVRAAAAPVVVETPGKAEDQAADIALLRQKLAEN